MNSICEFLLLSNGTSVPWADVPEWPTDEFVAATAAESARGSACRKILERASSQ
jgi:hypothetical protein